MPSEWTQKCQYIKLNLLFNYFESHMLNGNALWVFHARSHSRQFFKIFKANVCVWSNKAIIIMIITKKARVRERKIHFY
jgi:hypothetical protein